MYQSSCFLEYSILGQGGNTGGGGEEDVCGSSLVADSSEALLVGSALAFEGTSVEECLAVGSGLKPGVRIGLEDVNGGTADRGLVKGSTGGNRPSDAVGRGEKSTSDGIKKL